MKIKICPICVVVSLSWLVLSGGIAWGYLSASTFLVPIALLMGGTVVGIAYLGEKRCRWAAEHQRKWKFFVVIAGMLSAYLFITHLTKFIVVTELLTLVVIAYFLFVKQPTRTVRGSQKISEIEEQMEQCC